MRTVVVLAIAVGCSGTSSPKWTFTAFVSAGQGNLGLEFGSGEISEGSAGSADSTGFRVFGSEVGVDCVHTIDIRVWSPLATQTYEFAAFQGSAAALYTDCHFGGAQYPIVATSGDIDVTRFSNSSCATPPCIEARFAFIAPAPAMRPNSFNIVVSDGYVSNR
jgi:hypothetical protein